MPRNIPSLIVLVLLSAAGLAIYLLLHKDRPAAAPDLTLLNESLHRTMESELGLPLLAQNLLELTVERQDLNSEIERIKNIAAKLGGNATVYHLSGGSDQDLLVEVPEAAAERCIEAVKDRTIVLPETSPGSGEKKQIIEVKLQVAK
jgi:hypothetical protein